MGVVNDTNPCTVVWVPGDPFTLPQNVIPLNEGGAAVGIQLSTLYDNSNS